MEKKEPPKAFKIALGLLVLFLVFRVFSCSNNKEDTAPETEQGSQQLTHKQLLESQFSAWDGSHKKLTEWIKSKMNDPESFEHVETKYIDQDSLMTVFETFTGKNAFGGRVKQRVKAVVDFHGNILSAEQIDAFD